MNTAPGSRVPLGPSAPPALEMEAGFRRGGGGRGAGGGLFTFPFDIFTYKSINFCPIFCSVSSSLGNGLLLSVG